MRTGRWVLLVGIVAAACACSDDKPTYGGGFESVEACIEGYETLDPDATAAEVREQCDDTGDDDSGSTGGESELLTCPSSLEVVAERRGGGFVSGVDAEYDARMDWDGDGVSCE